MRVPHRSLLCVFPLAFVLATGLEAQRAGQPRFPPPLVGPTAPVQPGFLAVDGDMPLTELARFAGRVDVAVDIQPYLRIGSGGTFTITGIPPGATILRAWLLVTSFDSSPGRSVSVVFDGDPFGPKLADVVDPGEGLHSSLYRFDVTSSVLGDGLYAYEATGHSNYFGDVLVVVYEHASLPLRTLVLHDGAESLHDDTTTTVFEGLPCSSGELTIFVQADNFSGPEEVRLNGTTVAGPADLFHANDGPSASLVTFPVTIASGPNTMELETTNDWFGLNLAILAADAALLDFETADDFSTALVNGQALSSPPEFGRLASLSSFGPNAGLAIFDTTPGGQNDPSQDRDLLVGRGNVLILQNSQASAQTVPGIFDRPNDDQDGGDLVLDFVEPFRPMCLVLVDIDSGNAQASSVHLTDAAGRVRTFLVPPRWTEDLLIDGPTGWRTLDLQTLAPQPGFASVATATQAPGFDAGHVVRLTVHLGSSGAIDDIVLASD